MGSKDVVSKDILKRIALDIARVLLHLKVDFAELLETEHQRVEDRRSDVVVLLRGEAGQFILHLEIQNNNDSKMVYRMLRYRSDIAAAHNQYDIQQYVIYIGKVPLSMADGIEQTGLSYCYRIIDMHQVDCQSLLEQDTPDALVLAILCDFKGRSEREVVRYIVHRLKELTGENENSYRNYMRMLEILSTNRSLEQMIEEEEAMLSQVDQTRLPSFRIGMRQGIVQGKVEGRVEGRVQGKVEGRVEGQVRMLNRLLERRFGALPQWATEKLSSATEQELSAWSDSILTAPTLEAVFNPDDACL